jgi:hypothetical protein
MWGTTRAREESPLRIKARKRMTRLPESDVLNWTDQAGTGVAKALDDYRRLGTPESLQEAREGLEALLGCIDALEGRRA